MNNEKKLWFKAKRFGWGWRPVSWQGWILTALYVAGLLHFFFEANTQHSASDFLLNYGLDFVVITIPFLIVCYLTGEKPKWNWSWKTDEKKPGDK